jgi:hypothetical protein
MKKRALAREKHFTRGNSGWKPELNEKVLAKPGHHPTLLEEKLQNFCICFRDNIGIVKFKAIQHMKLEMSKAR